jgi:hypothetical protein
VSLSIGSATFRPLAVGAIIDSPNELSDAVLAVIARRIRAKRQLESLPAGLIEIADERAVITSQFLFGVHFQDDGEILISKLKILGGSYFDVRVLPVEAAAGQIHAMILSVILLAGIIATIALQLPIADESVVCG